MIKISSGIVLVWVLVLSTGCASVYDSRHRYEDGWRASKVLKVASTGEHWENISIDCRPYAGQPVPKGQRYAYIRYLRSFAARYAVVSIPSHLSVIEGDEVFFNTLDCAQPIEPFIRSNR